MWRYYDYEIKRLIIGAVRKGIIFGFIVGRSVVFKMYGPGLLAVTQSVRENHTDGKGVLLLEKPFGREQALRTYRTAMSNRTQMRKLHDPGGMQHKQLKCSTEFCQFN